MAMSTTTTTETAAVGRTPFWALAAQDLAPRPDLRAAALLAATCCTVVVVVTMVFQTPLPAFSAYIVFFISVDDTVRSSIVGIAGAVAATLAVSLSILFYAFASGEPGLRIPLLAGLTVLGMYASRAPRIGPLAFLSSYVLVFS